MGTCAALLLVAWLPGAVLFRLPVGERRRRSALPAAERGFWAVILSLAWSTGLTVALSAVGIYHLTLLLVINGTLSLIGMLAARLDLRLEHARHPDASTIVPVLIVAAGSWLYFPPSEYIVGGKDPGIYVNEAIQMAQRGSLVVDDPVVATVPPAFRDLFFPSHQNPAYYSLRFMGFFIQDPSRGAVVGQFPHLYPASMAIAYGLNGLSGARQAVGAATILGLLATYFLGSRLLGPTAAALGTILLALNVVMVWFGRYPNAEAIMLGFLTAALLALARALVDGDRFFEPVAAFLLGLLIFLRVDAVLAVGGVIGGLLVARVDGRRVGGSFWLVLAGLLALGGWYLTGPMRAYLAYPVIFAQNLQLTSLGVGAMLLVVSFLLAARHARASAWMRRTIPAALAGAFVIAALYAYFVRQPGGRLAPHDAMALRSFARYVTAPGLLLAVAGFTLLLRRRFWHDPTFFATAAVFAAFFFYKIRIVPDHFWMARRFVPVILPVALLMVAGLVVWAIDGIGARAGIRRRPPEELAADRHSWWRSAGAGLACLVLAPLGWAFWQASRPVVYHVEYAGLIPRLERLAARFGDEDLVLVESRSASDVHVLALPLAYIYARNVLVLNTPRPDPMALAGFLGWAGGRYREVYFLGGGGTDLLSRQVGVEAVEGDRFQLPEYESLRNAYPRGVRQKEFDYTVYRFVPPREAGDGGFVLDVGTNDDLLVVRFHAKEREPATGMTYRWSRDSSFVTITGVTGATREVAVWIGDGGRPATAGPARVTVTLDDRTLGVADISGGVRPYVFSVPADVAAAAAARDVPARLRLMTTTWNPRAALGVPDDRDLGVVVDRVEAR